MGATGTTGERYAAVRGVAALAVMLGAARLPERLAGAGVALAARIAPPETAEDPMVVRLPAQRSYRTSAANPITV